MKHSHTDEGRKKALLIAVRSVKGQDLRVLHHAHEDALLLRNLLIDTFGYVEENVVLMMDDIKLPSHLWPSRKNILEQITKMVADASANDRFFFYYSGHGNQMPHVNDTEADGEDEVIYAYTGHRIIDDTLKKRLVMPLPRGSKLFALWGSSYPGSYLDLEHHNCNGWSPSSLISLTEPSFPVPLLSPGTIQDPPSTLNGVKLVRPHSPTSWLPHMFPDSSPSAHARSLSPIVLYLQSNCTGHCQKMSQEEQQEAQVVSLSASNEYHDLKTGGNVTKFFIECMSQDPRPSLSTLLRHIEDRVIQLHERGLIVFRRDAVDNLDEYMNSRKAKSHCQNVEITSRYPLDMDQLVDTIF